MTPQRERRLRLERLEDRSMMSAATPGGHEGIDRLVVMSKNIYLGGDIVPATAAIATGSRSAIVGSMTQLWKEIQATNFPQRADAIAREIAENGADLVALQEVVLFRTGVADALDGNATRAEQVEADYLTILLDELAPKGSFNKVLRAQSPVSPHFHGTGETPVAHGAYCRTSMVALRDE